ncbi:MAG: hypothetical protein GX548_00285, partial [Lentisphaerae bacterium]|nr:hypothetical protein [Lentisphaerota bacterium]
GGGGGGGGEAPSPAAPWSLELDWGPLVSSMADADGNERVRAAGPFWETAEGPDGMRLRAVPRPLYTRAADPSTKRASWDSLWPLASGRTFGPERSWRVGTAYFQDSDRTDPASAYRFWLLPVWFHGRDRDQTKYAALFPVGGEIRNILFKDSIRFALWPLWVNSRVNDVRTTDVLFPVFSRTTTPDGRIDKVRVFPLYSRSKKEGQFEKTSLFWPVWTHARYLHPKAKGTAWVLFPVCGRVNLNSQKGWMFLPPFFQHVRGEGVTRTFFPWPFFQRETGERSKLSVWPLFGYRVDGPLRRSYWLWPIVNRERNEWGRRAMVRWSVVPFYTHATYSSAWLPSERRAAEASGEALPEPEVTGKRTKLWPLVSRQYDREAGAYRLRLLDLWPGSRPPPVERNWAPIWTLLDYRARGASSDLEVLWGLYRATRREEGARTFSLFPLWRHERTGGDGARRWSVLKGLMAYDRTATNRHMRFLWLGRIRLATPEATEPDPS